MTEPRTRYRRAGLAGIAIGRPILHRSEMRAGPLNRDVILAGILWAAAFTYLHLLWPNSMVGLDEGAFLYEAKRIADGDVMYRDFFDLIGPIAPYWLALMYALFGVSMEAARASMAGLHGAIVVLMYAIARQLGVRPLLAVVVALAHVALFYPALPFASPHWLSTALTLVVFWFVLRAPVIRIGPACAAGALTALVALTHQPKGAATAAAVAIVLLRDAWTGRLTRPPVRALARQLAAYAVGLLAVVVPTLVGFVWLAGFEPVYDALVRTPLVAYRQLSFHSEGRWLIRGLNGSQLFELLVHMSPMLLLSIMPLIIPVSAARLIWQAVQGVRADARRPLFVAVVFSALAIASVQYQPNFFHFAIVGPIWFSLYGELLEQSVRRVEAMLHTALVGPAAAVGLLVLLTLEMRRSVGSAWDVAGAPGDTAFGRVHFRSESLAEEVEAFREVLQQAGAKEILVYPSLPGMYLMTGASNPTRFQLLIPGYNTPEQFAEVQQTLERERVPFVVRTFWWWGEHPDPLRPYLNQHYERVRVPRKHRAIPSMTLLRRKAEDAPAPPLE